MKFHTIFRGLLSILLTAALFLLLPEKTAAEEIPWNLYFGLLHAHTDISDGKGTVEEAFLQASQVEGLDFFAVTDHSNSFDNANAGAIGLEGTGISTEWAAGKAAAEAVTSGDFVGLFGYEMTWRDSSGFGHINTFGTPGWADRNQKGFSSLTAYYDLLTTVPGSVSQFNHPGTAYGDFQNFSHWSPARDKAVSLLEVGDEKGFTGCSCYIRALDKGWHVAPTLSQNNHHGGFGTESDVRTVVLAEKLTEDSLYDALRSRRVYATEDRDLQIHYTLNGYDMGAIIPYQTELSISLRIQDPSDPGITVVEVLTGGGTIAARQETDTGSVQISLPGKSGYYFLRIIQSDGDVAVTAPVWVEEPEPPSPSEPVPAETVPPESTVPEPADPEPTETDPVETQPSAPAPTQPEESQPTQTEPEEDYRLPGDLGVSLCRGLLHAHTDISDGDGTVEEAFRHASTVADLDFFAVTDHSNSFDNNMDGVIGVDGTGLSADWTRGKTAAESATTEDFLAIFGYEMTWPDDRNLGHICTFGTPGWISRNREEFGTLERYYEALATVPGSVSQFCHPGPELGDFENFAHYSARYDEALSLLEVGGREGISGEEAYRKALDALWHVAPSLSQNSHQGSWGSESSGRTVVLAEALTEDSLFAAIRRRQVYATEDQDLSLYYTLDDALMGSIIPARETHSLRLLLSDPTDPDGGTVEVITGGGETVDACTLPEGGGEITLTITGGGDYYYLRITQTDGDVAVTAPVWTEQYEDAGIRSFTCDTAVPLPGQQLQLTLELFNEEAEVYFVDSLTLYADGSPVHTVSGPGSVNPAETLTLSIPYTRSSPGPAILQVEISGTVGGVSRCDRAELSLQFRSAELVKGVLVDLGHSSHSPEDFDNLVQLADEANMTVTFLSGELTEEGSILILPAPERAYETEFLLQMKIFSARGGSVVVCGSSDRVSPQAASQQNMLLKTLGSTICLREDTALDPVHNGGQEDALYPAQFNPDTFWCEKMTPEQYYVHLRGCTLEPGQGSWLVKGASTSRSSVTGETAPVLLAWEELSPGGHILAAGSPFLSDDTMPLPQNRWDAPSGNQIILEALLGITRVRLPITPIADVRNGEKNVLYRVKGFATSGTSNPYNTFPETIYLQDDTGGIAVSPFREEDIQVGTSMDVVGYLENHQGNLVLMPVDHALPEESRYRYVPDTLNHSRAMDYETLGGQLIQVQAKVTSVTLTEDGLGVRRFIVTDRWGDDAAVLIEDGIFSGAYGTNTLASEVKIGRTVRAMGLLHLDSNGIPVIRVRNCEEVVWVPPIPRPGSRDNPYTGDSIGIRAAALPASLCGILLVSRRRRKQSDR